MLDLLSLNHPACCKACLVCCLSRRRFALIFTPISSLDSIANCSHFAAVCWNVREKPSYQAVIAPVKEHAASHKKSGEEILLWGTLTWEIIPKLHFFFIIGGIPSEVFSTVIMWAQCPYRDLGCDLPIARFDRFCGAWLTSLRRNDLLDDHRDLKNTPAVCLERVVTRVAMYMFDVRTPMWMRSQNINPSNPLIYFFLLRHCT